MGWECVPVWLESVSRDGLGHGSVFRDGLELGGVFRYGLRMYSGMGCDLGVKCIPGWIGSWKSSVFRLTKDGLGVCPRSCRRGTLMALANTRGPEAQILAVTTYTGTASTAYTGQTVTLSAQDKTSPLVLPTTMRGCLVLPYCLAL